MWSRHRPSQGPAWPAPERENRHLLWQAGTGTLPWSCPSRLLGPQLSRLPPPVFFLSAQCAPRADSTVGLVWGLPARPAGFPRPPGTCLPALPTQMSTWPVYNTMHVCLCAWCARVRRSGRPLCQASSGGKEDHGRLRTGRYHIPCLCRITHEVLVETRHAVPSILAACPVVWSGRRIQGALPKTRKTFGGLVLVDFDTGLNLSKAAGLASGQRVPRRTTLAPVPLTLYPFSAFCPRRNMPTCPPALPTCPDQTLPVLASPTCLPSIH